MQKRLREISFLKREKNFSTKTWEQTIIALNNLQSNVATLERALKTDKNYKIKKRDSVLYFLKIFGVDLDDLNKLNVIHVAGTKGKGSTCFYVESILRHQGYKTGLYTSPHLISCRERIQINGQAISEQEFISYFWPVYEKIMLICELENNIKPGYFMFLTILAFYIFFKSNVHVLVLETGIGGEYDCTNVVTKPKVVGISCLGLDHVKILGSDLKSIAWNKSGIIKPYTICFTVKQEPEAFNIIKSRAEEKNSMLFVCPSIHKYKLPNNRQLKLGIDGSVQSVNASLAIQLSKMWVYLMKNSSSFDSLNNANEYDFLTLNDQELDGLANTVLNGRCQLIKKNKISYYLDGAHTIESMNNCVTWFINNSFKNSNLISKKVERILLFNVFGSRDLQSLINCLIDIPFDLVIFSSNKISLNSDLTSESLELNNKIDNLNEITNIWKATLNQAHHQLSDQNKQGFNKAFSFNYHLKYKQYNCLEQALDFINHYYNTKQDELDEFHVLVTGSLHLVGNTLSLLKSYKFF